MYSPLEQFEVIGTGVPGVTNTSVMMFRGAVRRIRAHEAALPMKRTVGAAGNPSQTTELGGGRIVPTALQQVVEGFYTRVASMVDQTMGEKGQGMFTFVYTLRMYILTRNRLGRIPYSFTSTSHLAITLTLALTVWIGKRIMGFRLHGLKRMAMMLPAGTPLPRVPIRVPLEIRSFTITFISLSVRLFANMLAGHILLKVIGGFGWTLLRNSAGAGRVGSIRRFGTHRVPRAALFVLMGLETGVAFIQAYVFSLLSCIYMADAIEGGH